MVRVILFTGLLLACGDLRRAAGAPSVLGPPAGAAPLANSVSHPKEELELESLKMKGGAVVPAGTKTTTSTAKPLLLTGMKEIVGGNSGGAKPPSAAPKESKKAPVKAAVNMEHPAPSDNDNENSEKNLSKQQQQQQQPFESSLLPPMVDRSIFDKPSGPPSSIIGSSGVFNAEQDYTPQDIAEYIFWTGDDKRIALALNDFLQDELVTKEDVVRFLEDVKRELTNLRARYSAVNQWNPPASLQSLDGGFAFDQPRDSLHQRYFDVPSKKDTFGSSGDRAGLGSYYDGWPTTGSNIGVGQNDNKIFWSSTPHKFPSVISSSATSSTSAEDVGGADYEEVFEKIRQADAKYREYSLEEVIYQLARELFSSELEDSQPQRSIQRFAHFVENEADLGRIPKDLSKAVLDTLVAALVDAVSEQGAKNTAEQQQQQQGLLMRRKPAEAAKGLKQKFQLEKLKGGAMKIKEKARIRRWIAK